MSRGVSLKIEHMKKIILPDLISSINEREMAAVLRDVLQANNPYDTDTCGYAHRFKDQFVLGLSFILSDLRQYFPFMRYIFHQYGVVKLYTVFRENIFVLKKSGADLFYFQGFNLPLSDF